MKYTNEEGVFIKGRWRDESVAEVADEDPEYLQWLLDEAAIDSEDQELIEGCLGIEHAEEEE